MNLSTYIIDDEAHAIATLADYVNRTDGLNLTGTSTDPLTAIQILNNGNLPDLIFLDVDMPGMSGLEFAGLTGKNTRIVFVTSYREFGPEAFELNAVDYLLKPISYARFFKCVQKLQSQKTVDDDQTIQEFIFVKGNIKGNYLKISVSDIYYIQADLHYVDIFLPGEKITTYLTLVELLDRLPGDKFCRVHRSYIINLERITAVEQSQIKLENKERIPLGRGYREDFFKKIKTSLIEANQRKLI
jgi:two-component system LytT family response regulator